jgi:hypothetical protein
LTAVPRSRDRSERGGVAAALLVALGAGLMVVGVALTLGKVGATTTTNTTSSRHAASASLAPAHETATAFLNELAGAIRSGDVTFMESRLNPAVIAHYGASACRATVAKYTDPTAAFGVLSVSAPADYRYVVAGVTKVIPDTLTLHVAFTQHGTAAPEVIHLSRTSKGTLSWYTDCGGGGQG